MKEEQLVKKLLELGWKWGYCYGHGSSEPCGAQINGETFVIADIEKTMVLLPPNVLFKEPVPYEEYF